MDLLAEITFRLNKVLSLVLLIISLYMIGMPFYPQAKYILDRFNHSEEKILEEEDWINDSDYNENQATGTGSEATSEDPVNLDSLGDVNKVVIPSIGVNGVIYEGNSAATLNNGIWRRPNTSTPDRGSNTVLTAHRFLYESGPITFYHLDKVKPGDKIYTLWNNKRYEYEVYEIKEVLPTQVEVESPTNESILTLYTCTPLWTAEKRLVVRAKLLNSN